MRKVEDDGLDVEGNKIVGMVEDDGLDVEGNKIVRKVEDDGWDNGSWNKSTTHMRW